MSLHDDDRSGARPDHLDALLDALIDQDRQLAVPRDLAQRVLSGLRQHEERALDALLDLGGAHDAAPPGLAERVLARVADDARRAATRGTAPSAHAQLGQPNRARRTWVPWGTLPRVAAAAAVLAVALGAWRFTSARRAEPARQPGLSQDAMVAEVPPTPELLELLPVLERWDLLQGDGAAVDLADLDTLLALEDEDELLVLLASEENG